MVKMKNEWKHYPDRPACKICGKPADMQDKLSSGKIIWRKSKNGGFMCYDCHDHTSNQEYLADKYVGSTLQFTSEKLKPTSIRINPAARTELNILVKKFGKQAARAVNHDLINGTKYFTMMLETFVSDQAMKKAEKIASEIEMTEENFVGNLSTCPMENLEMIKDFVDRAIADKKQTAIIMND